MDPWTEAERRDLDVRVVVLPDSAGGGAMVYDESLVLIDARLEPCERRAVLCHELVHHERGPLRPACGWVVGREERRIDDEVARRLVPVEGLRTLAAENGGVDSCLVMERFGVPRWVAERALALSDGWAGSSAA